jgi:hypothetical protein
MNAPPVRDLWHQGGPGKLWSLWDMLELNAADFYEAVTRIQHARTSFEERPKSDEPISDELVLSIMRARLDSLEKSLKVLNARVTSMAVAELRKSLDTFIEPTYADVAMGFKDVGDTLRRELTLAKVLVLEPKAQEFYAPQESLLGIDFELSFLQQGSYELDEAAKCFALGRPTASVFHCMRLLEVGIRAMARSLGISDPIHPAERNWAVILKTIKDGIEAKWSTTQSRSTGDGVIFESLYASLDAIKNPWRNAAMHVEGKYTDAEAEHILFVVKGFMKKLSDRMDEDGNPKA